MLDLNKRVLPEAVLALVLLGGTVSAAIATVPCTIANAIGNALLVIGPSIVLLMFIYGAAKYAYSAEDPGGRKQGRDICIHAIIGGIIIGLWAVVIGTVSAAVTAAGGIFKMC
jgi:hypothetical protein